MPARKKYKYTTKDFVKLANKKHGVGRYSYSKSVYVNWKTPIIIICNECFTEFNQEPNKHLFGYGCRVCAFNELHNNNKSNNNEFIKKSKNKHPNKFGYSFVKYIDCHTEITLECLTCNNIFNVKPKTHLEGKGGCKVCQKRNNLKITKKTKEKFTNQANGVHGIGRYDYTFTEIDGMHSLTIFVCNFCNFMFETTPTIHLRGSKCPECVRTTKVKTLEKFVDESNDKHKFKYWYTKSVYVDIHTDIEIGCKKCGLWFWQSPNNHLRGQGCPHCATMKFISDPEIEWLDSLNIPKKYRQKHMKVANNRKIIADAYDPNTKTIYEFFGDFYHGNPIKYDGQKINPRSKISYGDLYKDTMSKIEDIKLAGYNIIYIWETDWENAKKKCEAKG